MLLQEKRRWLPRQAEEWRTRSIWGSRKAANGAEKKNGRVLGRRKINSLDGLMGLQLYKFQWAYGPNVDGSDREFKRINIRMLYLFREADD
jgi:hypothetical protein